MSPHIGSTKHETLLFRLAVGAFAIAGLLVLGLSLHGWHRPPPDSESLPSVVGPSPLTPAR